MRHSLLAVLPLLALASCRSRESEPVPAPAAEPVWSEAVTDPEPSSLWLTDGSEMFVTNELGTDVTRGRAKTIDWMQISTTEGMQYLGGAVVIDRIHRLDASDLYGVKVRLRNTTPRMVLCEVQFRFLAFDGLRVISLRIPDGKDRWERVALEPFELREIADHATLRGAVGFDLRIRPSMTKTEGKADSGPTHSEFDSLRRAIERGPTPAEFEALRRAIESRP